MNPLSCAITHPGNIRQRNEDAFLNKSQAGLWAVADGMGGHDGGQEASAGVIEALEHSPLGEVLDTNAAVIIDGLQRLNEQMNERATGASVTRAPGSTVAALMVVGAQFSVIWAGDSRVYRLRGDELKLLTRDHSHVQELIDLHLLTPESAESHPLANVITRAVGVQTELECESLAGSVEAGDRFLLCTDGLSRVLEHATLASLLRANPIDEAMQKLLDATLYAGAPDNVTLVIVEF